MPGGLGLGLGGLGWAGLGCVWTQCWIDGIRRWTVDYGLVDCGLVDCGLALGPVDVVGCGLECCGLVVTGTWIDSTRPVNGTRHTGSCRRLD